MAKTLTIGIKDLKVIFRDRAALLFMLLAPFLLTLALGLVSGRFSGNSSGGLRDIPVTIINQDDGQLGQALVEVFSQPELADLLEPTLADSLESAQQQVNDDKSAAVLVIPGGFSASIIPAIGQTADSTMPYLQLYTNPTRPTSSAVVKTVVESFLAQVEISRISGEVSITQLLESGRLRLDAQEISKIAESMAQTGIARESQPSIRLQNMATEQAPDATEFDPIAFMAPGMALMFLMYTVGYGGRSILQERMQGTLPRLLTTPTRTSQIFLGKILGILLSAIAQVGILILASTLLFQLDWGDPLALLALIFSVSVAATGWGVLITALSRTPNQVSTLGSAIMLIFGILGGSFVNVNQLHPVVQVLSRITPNAWGLDGFTALARGATFAGILYPLAVLLAMGIGLFAVAVIIFNRQTGSPIGRSANIPAGTTHTGAQVK
jgi:ABC-2 type transport system permease protein